MGSYEGEKGDLFLRETWIVDLAKPLYIFLMVSISNLPTIKYWYTLEKIMVGANEDILKELIIGDTHVTSLSATGVNLFTRNVLQRKYGSSVSDNHLGN